MALNNNKQLDTHTSVLRVILTTPPAVNQMSNIPNTKKAYFCYGISMQGFQIQIDLQSMPPGVSIDQIQPNQVWWVEKRTTLYRLYLYGGTYDPSTRQIDTTDPLPPSVNYSYYGSFYSTQTQTGTSNSIQAMNYNYADGFGFCVPPSGVTVTVSGNNFVLSSGTAITSGTVNGSRIYAQYAGTYNLQFSAQFVSSNASSTTATVWLRKNGSDVAATAGIVTLAGQGDIVTSWNYIVKMGVADYVELIWSGSSTTVSGASVQPAGITAPLSPSFITTITAI